MAKSLKTLSAFAKQIGVTPATMTYYRRLGFLNEALIFKPGKKIPLVDCAKAKKLIRKYKDPAYAKSGQTSSQALTRAKREMQKVKADIARFNLDIAQGKLVSKAKVKDKAFRAGREFRDALQNIPSRTAAILAAEPDEEKCRKIILKEVRPLLDEFERKLKQI